MQGAPVQIRPIDVGDLQLASGRGLETSRDVDDIAIVEVQAGHGIVRFRSPRFLLDALDAASPVKLHHAVTLGVFHPVGEHRRPSSTCRGSLKERPEPAAVEDVVPQHERRRRSPQELAPDQERLSQTLGPRLLCVPQGDSELTPVPEEHLESRQILWRRDDQNVLNPR